MSAPQLLDEILDDDVPVLIDHQVGPSAPEDTAEISHSVPLTIISGFLGAGKSTLLRRILTEHHGYRIAVIMNDFGDTAYRLVAKTINVATASDPTAEASEEVLELANGCLCCSIKDSGIAAIEKLMQRKGAFDYILLETTGLADPGPIASIFWQNEDFTRGSGRDITLDGVVCVVDAMFGRKQIEEDHADDGIGESLRQVAAADVILLNKVDLVSTSELEILEAQLRMINPAAAIHRTTRAEVDVKHVVNINAYASGPSRRSVHDHDHDADTLHEHGTHYEVRGISSLQVSCPVLTPDTHTKLDAWIRSVLWEREIPGVSEGSSSLEVLRCKGMFRTTSGETFVLQGVRSMYDIAPLEAGEPGELEEGKLVLIGKGLGDAVRSSLQALLNSSS
ncbi:CobW domain-containing protein [Auriscalpium vulgare]|uniref:CobW domain-containing protein n=1 Tax=Auriscalpium vulgare TaxID=40419 RepID=A0ACB8S501_9AGAM|nr:CobW domain-containing protein [Auriscalpium vulgare]